MRLLENYHIFVKQTSLSSNTKGGDHYSKQLKFLANETKLFYIEKDIKELLLHTDNNHNFRKLPFDFMFLDINISKESNDICGLWISNKFCTPTTRGFKEGEHLIRFFVNNFDRKATIQLTIPIFGDIREWINDRLKIEIKDFNNQHIDKLIPIMKEIQLLVCNFLDFLNNPEVEIVIVERTKEQNLKRIKRGKIPLPTVHNVRVTGKLKNYINELKSGGHFNYSHRFWVRGNFMRFRNRKRYSKIYSLSKEQLTKKGYQLDEDGIIKKWRLPYIKGKGILINKTYEVSADSSHN